MNLSPLETWLLIVSALGWIVLVLHLRIDYRRWSDRRDLDTELRHREMQRCRERHPSNMDASNVRVVDFTRGGSDVA